MLTPQQQVLTPQQQVLTPQQQVLTPQQQMLLAQQQVLTPQQQMLLAQQPVLTPQQYLLAVQNGLIPSASPQIANHLSWGQPSQTFFSQAAHPSVQYIPSEVHSPQTFKTIPSSSPTTITTPAFYRVKQDSKGEPGKIDFPSDAAQAFPKHKHRVSKSCGGFLVPYFGLESTFLFPVLSPATTFIHTVAPTETIGIHQNDATLDGNLFVSPRGWLGLQFGCWGVETRIFYFQPSELTFSPQSPLIPRNFSVTERIDAWNTDAEIFKKWCSHHGDDRRISVGFRYFMFETANEATMDYVFEDEFALASATAIREVHGPGITFALQGAHLSDFSTCHRQRCGKLKFFWNLRGAVIFAKFREMAHADAIVFDSFNSAAATSINTAVAEGEDVAFNAEIQLGLQYERPLACSSAKFFCRAGFEYQFWGIDGGIAAAGSTAFTNNVTISSGATVDDWVLHLVGAFASTGLMW